MSFLNKTVYALLMLLASLCILASSHLHWAFLPTSLVFSLTASFVARGGLGVRYVLLLIVASLLALSFIMQIVFAVVVALIDHIERIISAAYYIFDIIKFILGVFISALAYFAAARGFKIKATFCTMLAISLFFITLFLVLAHWADCAQ